MQKKSPPFPPKTLAKAKPSANTLGLELSKRLNLTIQGPAASGRFPKNTHWLRLRSQQRQMDLVLAIDSKLISGLLSAKLGGTFDGGSIAKGSISERLGQKELQHIGEITIAFLQRFLPNEKWQTSTPTLIPEDELRAFSAYELPFASENKTPITISLFLKPTLIQAIAKHSNTPGGSPNSAAILNRIKDTTIELRVILGETQMPLKDICELRLGQIIMLSTKKRILLTYTLKINESSKLSLALKTNVFSSKFWANKTMHKKHKNFPPPQKPENRDAFFVEGFSAVEEYLKHRPKALLKVFCKPSSQQKAKELCAPYGVTPTLAPKPSDNEKEKIDPIWAETRVPTHGEQEIWPRLKGRDKDTLVVLDHITDPRNLGAIVRTAAFFGIKEILAPKDRQVGITQTTVATAQGGFALCDYFCVTNIARTLEKLKQEGYWIIGTHVKAEALNPVEFAKKVIVFGSEDRGISNIVMKQCDVLMSIPSHGFDSLNVSVAAGIFLHQFSN